MAVEKRVEADRERYVSRSGADRTHSPKTLQNRANQGISRCLFKTRIARIRSSGAESGTIRNSEEVRPETARQRQELLHSYLPPNEFGPEIIVVGGVQ